MRRVAHHCRNGFECARVKDGGHDRVAHWRDKLSLFIMADFRGIRDSPVPKANSDSERASNFKGTIKALEHNALLSFFCKSFVFREPAIGFEPMTC